MSQYDTLHDTLTEKELANFYLNKQFIQVIEKYHRENSLEKQAIKILDFGCGRGKSVAKLREQGYQAYGVDIEPYWLNKGRKLLIDRGLNPDTILVLLDNLNRFEDGFFDVVISSQVFEHVEDMHYVAKEIWRLTKDGGVGIHVYPGDKEIWEGHLFIPLVHWLPKNSLRKIWIIIALLLGFGPPAIRWPITKGKNLREKADIYYRYSIKNTYYRSIQTVKNIFESQGFKVEYSFPFSTQVSLGTSRRRFFPKWLRDTGFPSGHVHLSTSKLQ